MLFEGIAWAQQAPSGGNQNQVLFTTIIPLAAMFAIFYFLLLRPQSQKAKEHAKMLRELKRNDEVVTSGGLVGRVTDLSDKLVTLKIAPNVRVRVERPQIQSISSYGKSPAKKEKSE